MTRSCALRPCLQGSNAHELLLISALNQRDTRTAATGTRQMITRPMTRLIPASASWAANAVPTVSGISGSSTTSSVIRPTIQP